MSDEKPHTYQPVSPVDADHSVDDKETKIPQVIVRSRRSSTSSSGLTLRTPKAARFTEATSVNSPIDPTATGRSPFADPRPRTTYLMPQPQPSDVGFGYVADNQASKHSSYAGVEVPLTPASPLKSALKPPGTPGRFMNPLSPTFKEEQVLEKQEESTDKQNAKDLKVKTRVRMAKMALRGVNFSCSLIVLAMLSTSLTIFNATKAIPPRSNLPPWAQGTKTWPQILLLCISCVSLVFTICILVAYRKGGHKRAQKAAAYYTMFAVGFFLFSTIMWIIGAAVLHQAKAGGNGKDVWGWSCKGGKRQTLFQDEIDYNLICRLQVSTPLLRISLRYRNANKVPSPGPSSAPSSKSSSKSSPSPSTPLSSTASIQNASSTNRWTCATAPAQTSISHSSAPNLPPTPPASKRPPCPPPSPRTCTAMTPTPPPKTASTTNAPNSRKSTRASPSQNHSLYNPHLSACKTPPRPCRKMASSPPPPPRSKSTSPPPRANRSTTPSRSLAPTPARSRAQPSISRRA